MKGIAKAIKRTPFLVTTKVGMTKKTNDTEFDEYNRRFTAMENTVEKLLKDTKLYSENVTVMLSSGQQWAMHFANIFHPLAGEYDMTSKNPHAAETIQNVDSYQVAMEELKEALAPELELIQSKVHAPAKELQGVMKQLRKTITKRDHKLTDYDRLSSSLAKLRDKKEKSLSDEKNLFKLEQDFEVATNEYEHFNNLLKTELPHFMDLATQFIDPLFHSYYYMQLNIFYIMMEKLKGFVEGKYTTAHTATEVSQDYSQRRGDVGERVDTSTAKMMATARAGSTNATRANTSASTTSTSAFPRTSTSFVKKAPPPPPTASSGAPPPYSVTTATAVTKRPPPPPPPLKSKSKPQPQYVVALYDFQAQAEGDLDFRTGDHIEIVERTASQDDWWTGKLNGRQGVFPGNYVQEA